MAKTAKKTSTKTRNYNSQVSKTALEKAKHDVQQKNMSVRNAAKKKWKLGKSTLHDYIKGKHTKPVGRQTVLSLDEEQMLCARILTLAEWAFPLDAMDLRMLVKAYLDRRGIVCHRFKNNIPGYDWVLAFLKRQTCPDFSGVSKCKD